MRTSQPKKYLTTVKLKDKEYGTALRKSCLLYTSPSPRDAHESRIP